MQKSKLEQNISVQVDSKVQDLQAKLTQKTKEVDNISQNLKKRITFLERENKTRLECWKNSEKALQDEREKDTKQSSKLELQIQALERHLKDEIDRYKVTKIDKDNVKTELDNLKATMTEDLNKQAENAEKNAKSKMASLSEEIKSLQKQNQKLLQESEKQNQESKMAIDKEVRLAESKLKSRLEKLWIEKLKKSETTAGQDVCIYL